MTLRRLATGSVEGEVSSVGKMLPVVSPVVFAATYVRVGVPGDVAAQGPTVNADETVDLDEGRVRTVSHSSLEQAWTAFTCSPGSGLPGHRGSRFSWRAHGGRSTASRPLECPSGSTTAVSGFGCQQEGRPRPRCASTRLAPWIARTGSPFRTVAGFRARSQPRASRLSVPTRRWCGSGGFRSARTGAQLRQLSGLSSDLVVRRGMSGLTLSMSISSRISIAASNNGGATRQPGDHDGRR